MKGKQVRENERKDESSGERSAYDGRLKLLVGLGLALVVLTVLIMSVNPGTDGGDNILLSQAMLSEKGDLNIDSQALANRVVEQKFQIHMEEEGQQMGEIPYVEVWVLNDPFYPLIGEVEDLRKAEGVLSSKEYQMLGFPDYTSEEETTGGGAPLPSQPPSSTPVTTDIAQRVVIVQEIYEIRGIRYATIKVNDTAYDKLKAGSEFADVFRVQEIKDGQTVSVKCGDETYELKVGQLRKP